MYQSNLLAYSRALLVVLAISLVPAANALDGRKLAEDSCGSCHRLDQPDRNTLTLAERETRDGPPLYFAGHKYREDWLEHWLQQPQTITPAGGGFWTKVVIVTDEGDEIDESKLTGHPEVSAEQAQAIAGYLSTLKPFPELIRDGEYKPGKAPRALAEKDFRKFKGCVACHRDEPDFGGVTGPELYTAMNRLQPEYIASYIRNPVAWEPKSLMPNLHLKDAPIHKLMNYLNTIAEDHQ